MMSLQAYTFDKIFEENAYVDSNFSQVQDFMLYLKPGGIPYEEEILMYDMLDLIGNVGGFLGLLLGASILSLMDSGREFAIKMSKR